MVTLRDEGEEVEQAVASQIHNQKTKQLKHFASKTEAGREQRTRAASVAHLVLAVEKCRADTASSQRRLTGTFPDLGLPCSSGSAPIDGWIGTAVELSGAASGSQVGQENDHELPNRPTRPASGATHKMHKYPSSCRRPTC